MSEVTSVETPATEAPKVRKPRTIDPERNGLSRVYFVVVDPATGKCKAPANVSCGPKLYSNKARAERVARTHGGVVVDVILAAAAVGGDAAEDTKAPEPTETPASLPEAFPD